MNEKEIPVKVRVVFEIPEEDGNITEMEASTQIELSEDSIKQLKTLFFETNTMSITIIKHEKVKIEITLKP
jgi:hypothetical protein